MGTKWDDTSWQKEFLEMKAHKPEVVRLLLEGPRGLRDNGNLDLCMKNIKDLKKDKMNSNSNERKPREIYFLIYFLTCSINSLYLINPSVSIF